MSIVAPAIVFGSAYDLSTGTDASTTCTVTSGVTDPLGGTGAYTLDDNAAGANEGRYYTFDISANGSATALLFAKQGTATKFMFGIRDQTAAVYRGLVEYTWSGGAFATISGSATTYTPISVGNSWYLFRLRVPSLLAANTNSLIIFPCGNVTTLTGTTSFYLRNTVLTPVIDNVLRDSEKKEGYEFTESMSGVVDAWDSGDKYTLNLDIRHIPEVDENTPSQGSGFDGLNELAGVNCGWGAAIRAGRNAGEMLWVPDRSDFTTYTSSVYAGPIEKGAVQLEEENGTIYRRFRLSLFNTASVYAGFS